jgi:6-phosphogluconolactonase
MIPVIQPVIHAFHDLEAASRALAQNVATELRHVLAAKPRATLIIPGGSTPARFLAHLGAETLDWARITVMPTDERCVAPDDARSNARMIHEVFTPVREGQAPYLTLHAAEAETPKAAATRLSGAVSALGVPDILISGMGEDAHIASIFPQQFSLSPDQPAVFATHPPGLEARLSLSAPLLVSVPFRAILIVGSGKRAMLDKAIASADARAFPVRVLMEGETQMQIYWAEQG